MLHRSQCTFRALQSLQFPPLPLASDPWLPYLRWERKNLCSAPNTLDFTFAQPLSYSLLEFVLELSPVPDFCILATFSEMLKRQGRTFCQCSWVKRLSMAIAPQHETKLKWNSTNNSWFHNSLCVLQVDNDAIRKCNCVSDLSGKDFFLGPDHQYDLKKIDENKQV